MSASHTDLAAAIAAANALYDTATQLRDEAWNWAKQECRDQLMAEAVRIEEVARATFRGSVRLDVADAFQIAAQHRLAQSRALRRFIRFLQENKR